MGEAEGEEAEEEEEANARRLAKREEVDKVEDSVRAEWRRPPAIAVVAAAGAAVAAAVR